MPEISAARKVYINVNFLLEISAKMYVPGISTNDDVGLDIVGNFQVD
jgi:hypothetical protein